MEDSEAKWRAYLNPRRVAVGEVEGFFLEALEGRLEPMKGQRSWEADLG